MRGSSRKAEVRLFWSLNEPKTPLLMQAKGVAVKGFETTTDLYAIVMPVFDQKPE